MNDALEENICNRNFKIQYHLYIDLKSIKKDGGNINTGNTVSLTSGFSTLPSLIKTNYKEKKIPSSFNDAIIATGFALINKE